MPYPVKVIFVTLYGPAETSLVRPYTLYSCTIAELWDGSPCAAWLFHELSKSCSAHKATWIPDCALPRAQGHAVHWQVVLSSSHRLSRTLQSPVARLTPVSLSHRLRCPSLNAHVPHVPCGSSDTGRPDSRSRSHTCVRNKGQNSETKRTSKQCRKRSSQAALACSAAWLTARGTWHPRALRPTP